MNAGVGKGGRLFTRHRYGPESAVSHQLACTWAARSCVRIHAINLQVHYQARTAMTMCATRQHLDVYAISDLHVDHDGNMKWLQEHIIPQQYGPGSVLIVAGDISDSLEKVREVLKVLKAAFWQVLFVPGNHELWVKGPAASQGHAGKPITDSLHKLALIQDACQELGVHTRPVRFGQLVIAPILSWHHQSWDQEPDIPEGWVPRASALTISDYARCVWPGELGKTHGSIEIAELLDSLNPPILEQLQHLTAVQDNDTNSQQQQQQQESQGTSQQLPSHGLCQASTHTEAKAESIGAALDSRRHSHEHTHTTNPIDNQATIISDTSKQQSTAGTFDSGTLEPAGLQQKGATRIDLITFSHFLTSQYLLPEKRFLTFPSLAKAVGSQPLHQRVKQLRPVVHVFGHTHFAWDAVPPDCGGVRHIQAPLCYPAERARRMRSIAMHMSAGWPSSTSDTAPTQLSWLPLLLARASYTLTQAPAAAAAAAVAAAQSSDGLADDHTASVPQQPAGCEATMSSAGQVLSQLPCLIIEQQWQQAGQGVHQTSLQAQPDQRQQHSVQAHNQQQSSCMGIASLPPGHQDREQQQTRGQEQVQLLVDQQAEQCRWEVCDWDLQLCPEMSAMWSDHYKTHAREPENTQLAPWVAFKYARRLARHKQAVQVGTGASDGSPDGP